jgi:hypothetical protein
LGVNTNERHYQAIGELANRIDNFDGVEWIPYHAYGGTKSVFLGGDDSGRKDWIPDAKELENARLFLKKKGVSVY